MDHANKYLFVYGTLREGSANEMSKLLRRSAHRIGTGRARGQLFSVADYPGFVPSDSESDWVYGDVYELEHPEGIYPKLDNYEGCGVNDSPPYEYHRLTVPVLLDSGRWIGASAYVYANDTAGKPRIDSGEFRSA
jgi:gamma-glutamylcyclotransferase (GGCT)/AIG2-like uncharacterized protein YtfP